MAGREDLAPKGSDVTSRDVSLEERNSLFNTTSGHDHDGTDSAKISWNNILDKPSFTTVENGLGIFTGRLLHREFLFPNAVTQAAFDSSEYTRDLNFEF